MESRAVAGGRLIVVQTNNATFGRSGETEQQLAMGRLRAVPARGDRTLATGVGSAPELALSAVGVAGLVLARRRSAA